MKKGSEVPARLVASTHPLSAAAEAYRTLRTNLGFAALDTESRLLLVTSTSPSEGKSMTAANLGVVLAQAGSRVLLVDCDLRRPSLHKVFGTGNGSGLTNVVVKGEDPSPYIRETGVPGLKLLPSGPLPPNPAEIVGSERMKGLWPRLLGEFDYVLVDSPPVLAVTDSVLLAGQVHGVILVVWAGATRVDVVKEAKERLERANARILGVVLNKVPVSSRGYHYHYYYYSSREEERIRL